MDKLYTIITNDNRKDIIKFYYEKLERKKRLLSEYNDKIKKDAELGIIQSEKRNILIAEISLIKLFIDDLKDL